MESKKISQLATELTPSLSDLTIIGDPTTGISKKITLSQMASLFTGTVEEYANLAAFPLVGVADTIYIALDTNIIYRWDTSLSTYVVLSPNIINSLVFSDANGFDGTITLVGSVATLSITTALTLGSVPFIGASGALTQDNSNLFFDDTNNRLGIATASPTTPLDVFGSGIIGRLNATSTNNAYLGFASNGTNKWSAGNVQSDHRFRIFSEANSAELISVLQTGEFGIGIANPTTKFHIDGAASALIANLDANVSVAKSVSFRSDNSNRINLEVSGTESGSNAGADFFLRTFTDAGSLLETPFTIVRSTGVTTIKSLTLTNVLSVANGGTGSATQNFVDLTSVQTAAGAKTFSAITTISNATASTSTTTGGLVVTGGVGIGGALFGTSATFSGRISFSANSSATASGQIGRDATYGLFNWASTGVTDDYAIFSASGAYIMHTPTGTANLVLGGALSGTSATFSGNVTSNATTSVSFYSGTYVSNSLGDGSFATYSGRIRENASFNLNIDLYDRTAATWRTPLSFNNTGGAATFSSSVTALSLDIISASGVGSSTASGLARFITAATTDAISIGQSNNTRTINLSSYYIFGNGNDNYCGTTSAHDYIFYTNSLERMRIKAGGYIDLNNVVYNDTASSPRTLYIASAGTIGGISSIRASKKNIENVSNIDWLYQLTPVTFNYRKKDENRNYTEEIYDEITYGLIAEDTQPIAEFLINYDDSNNDKKMIGIEYMKLITPMLKAIQEQQIQIQNLQEQINILSK